MSDSTSKSAGAGVKAPSTIPGTSLNPLEKRILELCEEIKSGITTTVIENDMPEVKTDMIVKALNNLLSKSKLLLLRPPNGSIVYKLKDPITQHKLKGVNKEDQAVYEIIERSGSYGIWARKIRIECNLHLNTVDRVLKRLEGKKLIKSVSSVQAPKKKFYLICGVEPDRSLTGGAFYSENQFDSEFVEVIMKTCFRYLEEKLKTAESRCAIDGPLAVENASKVTAKEMQEYITRVKLSKIKLSVEDVEKLLDTLVLDSRVMLFSAGFVDGVAGVKLWRAVPDLIAAPHLVYAPCGVCPLIDRCADIGSLTPQSCHYMDEWLE